MDKVLRKHDRKGRADLEAAYRDLAEARQEVKAIAWGGRGIDFTRERLATQKRVARFVKGLRPGLQEAQRFFRESGYAEPTRPLGPDALEYFPKVVRVVDRLLDTIASSDKDSHPGGSDPRGPARLPRLEMIHS